MHNLLLLLFYSVHLLRLGNLCVKIFYKRLCYTKLFHSPGRLYCLKNFNIFTPHKNKMEIFFLLSGIMIGLGACATTGNAAGRGAIGFSKCSADAPAASVEGFTGCFVSFLQPVSKPASMRQMSMAMHGRHGCRPRLSNRGEINLTPPR